MRTQSTLTLLQVLLVTLSTTTVTAKEKTKTGVTKAQGPPPFFLQDTTDSLCLAGDEFKRCSIDTLFFVVGQPGTCAFV
jgi:hypothetical protein